MKVTDEVLEAMFRLNGAVWFSILEALGPGVAGRAADNMRDLGVLYSDNPYVEHLCNTLAAAESAALNDSFDFRDMLTKKSVA